MPSAKNRRPPTQSRRVPVAPIVLGVIALFAVIAVVVSRGGDGGDSETPPGVEQTRAVEVTGSPLPPAGQGADPAVGSAAPELDGASFDGTPLRIAADGRAKVLVFLAHWCPHCQREVPVLADWLKANELPDGVDVYGVATSTNRDLPNYPPSAWLEREAFDAPTLADDADSTAAGAFGLSGFPFFVALDAQHQVVARASGELTVERWEELLDAAAGVRAE